MVKRNGFTKLFAAVTLSITILGSTMPMNSFAAKKPWYEDSVNQLVKSGVMNTTRTTPLDKVKAGDFLKAAVLWFTYNHGEDFSKVVNDLQWVKIGEIKSNNEPLKRGEAVRIIIRAMGLDNKESKSLKDYMEQGVKLGLVKGYGRGSLGENDRVDYAQLATIFINARKIQNASTDNKGVEKVSMENFFKTPSTLGYSLSPDGKYLAYVAPWESRRNVFIVPADGGEAKRITSSKDRDIADYAWKDDKIIYLKDNGGDENYHIYLAGMDGVTEDKDLTPYPGVLSYYVDMLKGNKNEILITTNKKDPRVFDIYKLNILTGETTMVAQNPGNITGWLTDGDGKLRIAGSNDGIECKILYREKEDDEFEPLLETKAGESFTPIMFSSDNKSIYATSNVGKDTAAIVKLDLDTKKQAVIYERKDVDVSSIIINPTTREVLGAVYNTDKVRAEIFNKDLKEIFNRVSSKFGNDKEVGIKDLSKDMNKFILSVGSDRDPGAYYFYDSTTDKLKKLGDILPSINPEKMAKIIPVSYKSRDGLTIYGYLTLPVNKIPQKLPVIVNPHGGPWARDSWGYNPEVQFLANRGYAVLQVNFRGSTGYGKKFVEAGNKQWGLKMQDDITDGVQWLIKQGIADPKRVGIYGASYGGYATLAGITFTPDLYAAAVDYCGVSNIFTLLNTIPPYWESQRKMFYERVGDPAKDKELLTKVSPVFHADKIKTPLFVAQGANDPRVNKAESDQIVDALKKRNINVEYMVKENEGHGFANEENRFDFYKAMESFFAKHLIRHE
ncbi:MAG TPA: S9 family peptidase [Pseudobacteroides sp.]|uniref:S9 family peptidase n=1 Tax=Pseudobacteroides sp. TaxID=1968840 RepID=UPI002F953205